MNSGSTVRMLLGVCAGANLGCAFDGDESLSPTPDGAGRGATAGVRREDRDERTAIFRFELFGTPEVETRHFILLAPSAQVKSALLFAGLFGGVRSRSTAIGDRATTPSAFFTYLGAEVEWNARSIRLAPTSLARRSVDVAGDFSAAAFFITAAAITPGSALS